jgi:hypothetical protein
VTRLDVVVETRPELEFLGFRSLSGPSKKLKLIFSLLESPSKIRAEDLFGPQRNSSEHDFGLNSVFGQTRKELVASEELFVSKPQQEELLEVDSSSSHNLPLIDRKLIDKQASKSVQLGPLASRKEQREQLQLDS